MCRNYSEKVAKLVLERIFPGSSMCYRHNQSHNEWDFDLRYQDGQIAAVEVTSSHDQPLTQIHAEIFKHKRGGTRIPVIECKSSWLIRPALGAKIKTIRKNADKYLAMLEAEEIQSFTPFYLVRNGVQELNGVSENLAKVRAELQLDFGNVISLSGEAEIKIISPISGRAVDATTAIRAAENEIEPNRKKLGRAGCIEHHLFIYIDSMNGGPWIAMVDFAPPQERPRLPREITHVWLVAQMSDDQFIIWSGGPEQPWKRTDLKGFSVVN